MSAAPTLPVATGRLVRPAYRAPVQAPVQSEADLLREDLGVALGEAERLRASLKKTQAALAGAMVRLNRQAEVIKQLRIAADGGTVTTIAALKRDIVRLTRTITQLQETLAVERQQAQLREAGDAIVSSPRQFELGRLTLDVTRRALLFDWQELPLSPGQLRLLACLFARPGTVYSTTQLIDLMGGQHSHMSIRSYVSRVRAKLRQAGAGEYLHSRGVWGSGGYWVEDPERKSGAPS